MAETKLTCIQCPLGCELTVRETEGGALEVSGNTCPRGAVYGEAEVRDPRRTVTGTVRVTGGSAPVVSVRTAPPVPKAAVMAVARALAEVEAAAPVLIGDKVACNIAGTGSDVVATASVREGERHGS